MSAFTMLFLKSHHEAIQDVVPELFPHSFLSVVFSWLMQTWSSNRTCTLFVCLNWSNASNRFGVISTSMQLQIIVRLIEICEGVVLWIFPHIYMLCCI